MKYPITPAIRLLRDHKLPFEPFIYKYEEKGGTSRSAQELGVPEEQVIKTLVMQDDQGNPLLILMQGHLQVSTKALARELNTKSITPCTPQLAQKHTGYLVGGTSPFGTRSTMPVFLEKSVVDLPQVYINGGKRGFLIRITPSVILQLLKPTTVSVGIAT